MNVFSHDNRPTRRAAEERRATTAATSRLRPSAGVAANRSSRWISLGQVTPARARFQDPENAVDDVSIGTRGRPPARERRGRGRCGSIFAHCASVSRTLRLATSTFQAPSGQDRRVRTRSRDLALCMSNGETTVIGTRTD